MVRVTPTSEAASRAALNSVKKTQIKISMIVLFMSTVILFAALRSRDMFAVDGAVRCLEVFRRHALFFHENNHMLYPADVLNWSRIAGAMGIRPVTPQGFFAMTELMNCAAAAGCVTILFYLSSLASGSTGLAIGTAAAYGLSRAFLFHATSAAEPMVGVFWSFLALGCGLFALKYTSIWPMISCGLLFSWAMATYQSTIFLAPAVIALFWYGRSQSNGGRLQWLSCIRDATVFVCAGVIGCFLVFGWAYWSQGQTTLSEMLGNFFRHRDAGSYFGVSIGKSLTLPIGMIHNLFPILKEFAGLQHLVSGPKTTLSFTLLLLFVFGLFSFYCVFLLAGAWKSLETRARTGIVVATTGLIFTLIPLLVWDPIYDKLWLQPLACIFFLIAISIQVLWRTRENGVLWSVLLSSALFLGLALNFDDVVANHTRLDIQVKETDRLATFIGTGDLLVGDWDKISTLYGYGWAKDGQFISFPTEAVYFRSDSVSRLRSRIDERRNLGGRIYFLELLDEPQSTWGSFLGSRCGVPFVAFDAYRANSTIRATFLTNSGPVTLREFDASH